MSYKPLKFMIQRSIIQTKSYYNIVRIFSLYFTGNYFYIHTEYNLSKNMILRRIIWSFFNINLIKRKNNNNNIVNQNVLKIKYLILSAFIKLFYLLYYFIRQCTIYTLYVITFLDKWFVIKCWLTQWFYMQCLKNKITFRNHFY